MPEAFHPRIPNIPRKRLHLALVVSHKACSGLQLSHYCRHCCESTHAGRSSQGEPGTDEIVCVSRCFKVYSKDDCTDCIQLYPIVPQGWRFTERHERPTVALSPASMASTFTVTNAPSWYSLRRESCIFAIT